MNPFELRSETRDKIHIDEKQMAIQLRSDVLFLNEMTFGVAVNLDGVSPRLN